MSLFHSPQIITSGLICYLDAFNKKSYSGSGTSWFDLSGNNNNFTSTGSPSFVSNYFSIPDSNSVYFSSNTPTNFRQGTSSFTISNWVYQNDTNANVFVESRGDNLIGYIFVANYPSSGKLAIFINASGGQSIYATTRSDLPVNTIQNIVVAVNRPGRTAKFYVNGSLWETISNVQTSTISPATGDLYRIGFDKGGSTSNYRLYTHMHYNKELSASEILKNFNALRARFSI